MIPYQWHSIPDWQQIVAREVNPLLAGTRSVASKSTAYTLINGDYALFCDATSAAFTVTLPPAEPYKGVAFVIKKIDASANAVTVDGNGSETIDGALTQALPAQWDTIRVISSGSAWFKV